TTQPFAQAIRDLASDLSDGSLSSVTLLRFPDPIPPRAPQRPQLTRLHWRTGFPERRYCGSRTVGAATSCTWQVPSPAGLSNWRFLDLGQPADWESWVTAAQTFVSSCTPREPADLPVV